MDKGRFLWIPRKMMQNSILCLRVFPVRVLSKLSMPTAQMSKLLSMAATLLSLTGIEVDEAGGKMYWTDMRLGGAADKSRRGTDSCNITQ
jgi:hypothetical protein